MAIACYPDTERDLAKLIDEELRVSISAWRRMHARTLMSLLGGDRQSIA